MSDQHPWWNPEVSVPKDPDPDEFPLDPVMLDLMIECLPPVQGWHDTIAAYWVEQADRDIYLETVEARGYDPLAPAHQ